MTPDEMRELVTRAFEELFNGGNLAAVDELIAPDFVDHFSEPLPNQPLHGPEAVKWYVEFVRTAFPDLRVEVNDCVVEGDKIAVRSHWSGTHEGQFVVIAPTHRHIVVTGIDIGRVRDGKIVEHWGGWNLADVWYQLGMLPGPEGSFD